MKAEGQQPLLGDLLLLLLNYMFPCSVMTSVPRPVFRHCRRTTTDGVFPTMLWKATPVYLEIRLFLWGEIRKSRGRLAHFRLRKTISLYIFSRPFSFEFRCAAATTTTNWIAPPEAKIGWKEKKIVFFFSFLNRYNILSVSSESIIQRLNEGADDA